MSPILGFLIFTISPGMWLMIHSAQGSQETRIKILRQPQQMVNIDRSVEQEKAELKLTVLRCYLSRCLLQYSSSDSGGRWWEGTGRGGTRRVENRKLFLENILREEVVALSWVWPASPSPSLGAEGGQRPATAIPRDVFAFQRRAAGRGSAQSVGARPAPPFRRIC